MRKLVIGMAMASTALTAPAVARDGQWYIQGEAGAMLVDDVDLDVDGNTDEATVDFNTGYDFGGLVGYDFGAFRLETEAAYKSASIDELTAGTLGFQAGPPVGTTFNGFTAPATGDVTALSFMLNGLFDFGPDDGLQAFAGGGVGVARVSLDGTVDATGPGAFDDSDTGLAWQLLAGIRAPISDDWDIGLKYRYFNAVDIDLVDTLGRSLAADLSSHSLLGTITYNFGGEAPPPPPPPPPPPTGPYIVFFDFDQSDITDDAAAILNQAVTSYANCGTASVMLAGHTDTSGSMTYNMALAERRNAQVQAYLVGRGIPEARIMGQAFGETDLKVPTADGVREQQNRRVVVTYGPNSGM